MVNIYSNRETRYLYNVQYSPSLRCIAVRFLPFPLHAPDGKCAHKQNVNERQTHIAIQNVDEKIRGEIAVAKVAYGANFAL